MGRPSKAVGFVRDEAEPARRYAGVTYIYGLIDPRNHQLRYVGKTVLTPARRLVTHRWQARKAKQKRHVLAWLSGLDADGVIPEIVEIERVPPLGDWEDAEQFWIAYFRFIGADLCNLTVGGDGAPGAKASEARKAKMRARCGPLSPLFGRPLTPEKREALRLGGERLRADPVRNAAAIAARKAGFTPEVVAGMTARFAAMRKDPEISARHRERHLAACSSPKRRAEVGLQSADLWATKRAEIISAQNAGKGDEWKRKQSVAHKKLWTDPSSRYWQIFLTPEEREHIRECLRQGMKGVEASKKFGLSQSRISQIKLGA